MLCVSCFQHRDQCQLIFLFGCVVLGVRLLCRRGGGGTDGDKTVNCTVIVTWRKQLLFSTQH